MQVHNNTLTNNDIGVDVSELNAACTASATTATNAQVHDNVIAKNDGITNVSPYTDQAGNTYAGYQVGVADMGDNDQVQNNKISSTDGAFGPQVNPGLRSSHRSTSRRTRR